MPTNGSRESPMAPAATTPKPATSTRKNAASSATLEEPSPKRKRTEANTKWVDGDFEAITADNVRSLVPSYYLFAARYVVVAEIHLLMC